MHKKIAANLFKMYIDKLNTGAPEGKRAGYYITFIFVCQVKNFFEKMHKKTQVSLGFHIILHNYLAFLCSTMSILNDFSPICTEISLFCLEICAFSP